MAILFGLLLWFGLFKEAISAAIVLPLQDQVESEKIQTLTMVLEFIDQHLWSFGGVCIVSAVVFSGLCILRYRAKRDMGWKVWARGPNSTSSSPPPAGAAESGTIRKFWKKCGVLVLDLLVALRLRRRSPPGDSSGSSQPGDELYNLSSTEPGVSPTSDPPTSNPPTGTQSDGSRNGS